MKDEKPEQEQDEILHTQEKAYNPAGTWARGNVDTRIPYELSTRAFRERYDCRATFYTFLTRIAELMGTLIKQNQMAEYQMCVSVLETFLKTAQIVGDMHQERSMSKLSKPIAAEVDTLDSLEHQSRNTTNSIMDRLKRDLNSLK